MSKDLNTLITDIARTHLAIYTLAVRQSDQLDFHELHVSMIRTALELAYNAGFTAGLEHGSRSLEI